MSRASICLLFAVSVVSCASEPPATSKDESTLTAQQLLDQALVIMSHDHVRNTDATGRSPHFQDAIAGHVTAMTIELVLDNAVYKKNGIEVFGPVDDGAVLVDVSSGYPFETMASITGRYNGAHTDLRNIVSASGGQVRLVETVQDIDAAQTNRQLGIIMGTEGALVLAENYPVRMYPSPQSATDVFNKMEQLYKGDNIAAPPVGTVKGGLRKITLLRYYQNAFFNWLIPGSVNHLSDLGNRLIPMLNKRGIIADVMHMDAGLVDEVAAATNAPLLDSHDWSVCNHGFSQATLDKIVATGGGHGVISVNAVGSFYPPVPMETVCGPTVTRDVAGLAETLYAMVQKVGIDHVAIGPDYQATDDDYTLPSIGQTVTLTQALMNRGFSDQDIKKILGGNLRDLYQRIWDPTYGIAPRPANFRRCSNWASDPTNVNADPLCVAASSNSGQGDVGHRALNCGDPTSGGIPVGQQLAYRTVAGTSKWMFKNMAGQWLDCSTATQGLTLVVSWLDAFATANGRFAIHGSGSCDASCQQAINGGGAGTTVSRALSCQNPSSNGIVGNKLAYSGGWKFYNSSGQPVSCQSSTTLVANWDIAAGSANAKVRLCDDYSSDAACAAATTGGGNGTSQAKAINCLRSKPDKTDFGTVALQVFYQDVWIKNPNVYNPNDSGGTWQPVPGGGHWQYWDFEAGIPKAYSCVHGSVLVASTLP